MESRTQIPLRASEFEEPRSFDQLAAQQGVTPIENFDSLLGRPCPGDESADEFLTMLRQWRREGTHAELPQ